MKINKLIVTIMGVAILGGFTATAMAENREGAITINPGIGAYLFDGKNDLKNSALYNLSIGYDFTNNWGVEAFAGAMNTNSKNPSSYNVTGELYTLDGIYHFNTQSPFEPFLMAGVGMLNLDPNGNITWSTIHGDEANTQANINGGAGIEYFVHPDIALRSDIRDVYTMDGGKNDYLVNFGVSILLGGQAPATPSPMITVTNPVNPCAGTKVVVRFPNSSSVIDPIYKTELQQVAVSMQMNHRLKAVVSGYASSTSTEQNNLTLSQQRANNVKDYLVKHDLLKSTRIRTQGFGEVDPIANAIEVKQTQNYNANEAVVVSLFDTGQN